MSLAACSPCEAVCAASDNKVLWDDVQFTRRDLEKALNEAQAYHAGFLSLVDTHPEKGLISRVTPDWAPKLVGRVGPVQAVIEKIGAMAFARRRPADPSGHQAYVAARYEEKAPLLFRAAVGPLKNIRCCGKAQHVDLAEYLAVIQLSRVMAAIAAVYPYGVRVEMVPDDKRAMTANRCPQCYVHCYIASLQALVANLGYQKWLHVTDGQEALYARYNTASFYDVAEEKIRAWQANDAEGFALRWEAACLNAEKNINIELIPPTSRDIEEAAWRYLVAHQSEILSGMWSTQHVFPLAYANHPHQYQLYTLGKKKTKLPWQVALPCSLVDAPPPQIPQNLSVCAG